MKMNRLKKLTGAFGMIVMVAGLTISCEPENDEMAVANTDVLKVSNATIEQSTLVGRWELSAMTSDAEVNLNDGDPDTSTNILEETTCFDDMYFIFNEDGTVKTGQAKLDFKNNGFSCSYGIYLAEYDVISVNDDTKLEVTFEVNGLTYVDSKTIDLITENGQEYLHVITTVTEVNEGVEAGYINDGRETTIVSAVKTLETVYIKVQ
ncbi:DUF5004 domain-containing protein [Salegentibacter sp. F188]|uniref:DUF5004 domain-containing protein n=1 Tax=Autumnicola patrickiae TaxID=3075591 RepID=A0ABU3E4X4_9FLAO|nr:DUF5004 domain-containing protein [Salegentibacter sp. F188]MDT0690689.1 DUF5004 domain-containing protein [Salegentibacter sp. F188]